MLKKRTQWLDLTFRFGAVLLALAFTTVILVIARANPLDVFTNIIQGALSSEDKIANLLVTWVPLLLVSAGLLATFSAGLWNIGIEGQITLGAIFTTGLIRSLQGTNLDPNLILVLGMIFGMIGGALWAALVGALKVFGGVNEIFGGLGLNFVATAITLWLIFGPWKRPGVGSMSGTEPFPDGLALPVLGDLRISPWALVLAVVGITLIYILLRGTYFGLRLKAVGQNIRSAFLMGIPTTRYMMLSFVICGLFAGLTGALQVEAVYHRLIPSISSGYGFLGLLVAMLVNFQAIWVAPVALFFAFLNTGSIQLPIVLQLDSTLSGVLQGALVLSVLLMDGARKKFLEKK
jgi:general nucleoside transport system permease protein